MTREPCFPSCAIRLGGVLPGFNVGRAVSRGGGWLHTFNLVGLGRDLTVFLATDFVARKSGTIDFASRLDLWNPALLHFSTTPQLQIISMRLTTTAAVIVGWYAAQSIAHASPQILETRLTQTPGVSTTTFTNQSTNRRSIVTSGDQVHVTWMEETDLSPTTYDTLYRRSDDLGQTWQAPVNLSDQGPNDWAFSPTIAVLGQDVHVAWIDNRDGIGIGGLNFQIYYRRSTDGGQTWRPRRRLSTGSLLCENVALATSGSDVQIVYEAGPITAGSDIYQVRSIDTGATWGAPINLTNDPESSSFPDIAFDGDDVHLVWSSAPYVFPEPESYVMHSVSSDRGVTFGTPQSLTANPARSLSPSLAISSGAPSTVHVAWMDDRASWDIYYARSVDGGLNWEPEVALVTDSWFDYTPFLNVSGADVYLTYIHYAGIDWSLRSIRSTDAGVSFGPQQTYTTNQEELTAASAALDGELLHTVWSDGRHGGLNTEIYYRREGSTGQLGVSFCGPAGSNSTGAPASMAAAGSALVADNDVLLMAEGLPAGMFGFFLGSQTQGFIPNAGGSAGNLCLTGLVARYNRSGEILFSGSSGTIDLQIDLTNTPHPMGVVSVLAGETWNFQAWFRDSVTGFATSNFTDGLSISFQ